MKQRTKTILEFTGLSLIVLAFAMFVMQYAEAQQTLNISDMLGQTIKLYDGESITVTNNQNLPHSIISTDGLFNSGGLSTGASYKINLPQQSGIYNFYDASTNQTGTIEMIYASLEVTPSTAIAGDMITIDGKDFTKNNQANIVITKPDGSTYQDLTIFLAAGGKIHLPVQTTRNDQNGIYTIKATNYDKALATFSLSGGYSPDAPLQPTPTITTNSTQTNSTSIEPVAQDAPTQTTTPTQSNPTTITIDTNSTFTQQEKETLIALLTKLIELISKSK